MREVKMTTKREEEEKLKPNWEGLYVIVTNNRPGLYLLKDMNGKRLQHPSNAEHLTNYLSS